MQCSQDKSTLLQSETGPWQGISKHRAAATARPASTDKHIKQTEQEHSVLEHYMRVTRTRQGISSEQRTSSTTPRPANTPAALALKVPIACRSAGILHNGHVEGCNNIRDLYSLHNMYRLHNGHGAGCDNIRDMYSLQNMYRLYNGHGEGCDNIRDM
jgi:hypothetical protein